MAWGIAPPPFESLRLPSDFLLPTNSSSDQSPRFALRGRLRQARSLGLILDKAHLFCGSGHGKTHRSTLSITKFRKVCPRTSTTCGLTIEKPLARKKGSAVMLASVYSR
jgi:hypothetical protein